MQKSLRTLLLVALFSGAGLASAQDLSVKWGELTAPDFVLALEQAEGVCMLPFGVVEKHGPAGPLATDLLNVRFATIAAAQREYAIVFPEYYFGQIFEAEHQPGTISYSRRLQLELLQETVSEMGRNGCTKVVIVNGHGGNTSLIQYFTQTQLDEPKDYVVYAIYSIGGQGEPTAAMAPTGPGVDGHAGEGELSVVMAHRPDLVHPERSPSQSGENLRRLSLPPGVTTGIWWYASFPNHYGGDSSGANAERGRAIMEGLISFFADVIRAIKEDEAAPALQREFFDRVTHREDTDQ